MRKTIILLLTFILLLTSFTSADYIDDMNTGLISGYTYDTNTSDGKSSYDGTTVGDTTHTNTGCIYDGCYIFDGTDDYITHTYGFPTFKSFNAWFKYSTASGYQVIGGTSGWASSDAGFLIGRDGSSGFMRAFLTNGAALVANVQATDDYDDGLWHMATITFDGTTNADGFNFYIDSSLIGSDTATSAAISPPTWDLNIGTSPRLSDGYDWNGYLDEINIFDYELSQTDINFLYNSKIIGTDQQYQFSTTGLSFILNYPINGTHYSLYNLNTSLVYNKSIILTSNSNVNCSVNNTDWSTISTGDLNHNFYNSNPTEGNYSIYVNCSDDTTDVNKTFWFIIDNTTASITVNSPLNDSQQYSNFYINVSIFDEFLYMANINLSKSGVTKYYNSSGELSGNDLYYNHTKLIDIGNGSYTNGYYTLFMEAWDTHTHNNYFVNEKINIKRTSKQSPKQLYRVNDKNTKQLNKIKKKDTEENYTIENEIEFKFKDHKLKIRTPKEIKVNYHNKKDRLTLDFESSQDFDKGLTYKIIEAERNIKLLENSPYNYHFIIDDNIWYDCEGLNVIAADRINVTSYKIYYLQEKDTEESHSFGGLNYFNKTYTIYIGHTILNYFIKDSSTDSLIDYQNVSFNMFYTDTSNYYNYTLTNGTLYIADAESGAVDITITSAGYNSFLESTTITEGQLNSKIFYLTNTSATTGTILKTIDSSSRPIENATIVIYQYLNESLDIHDWNAYSVIQTVQTNFEGETTYEFIQETQYYRFKIYVNDILIEETSPSLIFRSQINFQVVVTPSQLQSLLFLTPSTTNLYETIIGSNYSYNFTWAGGDLKGARLSVVKRNMLGGEQLLQEVSSSMSYGNLYVSFIPDQEAKYIVEGWVDTNTENSFFPAQMSELNFSDNFGILKTVGLIISYFIILALSLLMTQHPAGSIIGCIIGLVFAAVLGLLNIATGSLILIITIGGLVVYLNKY